MHVIVDYKTKRAIERPKHQPFLAWSVIAIRNSLDTRSADTR
ncbi:MAG TPA: hypothetical protein VGJ20_34535 [Xanthobacteraceae bacterium]